MSKRLGNALITVGGALAIAAVISLFSFSQPAEKIIIFFHPEPEEEYLPSQAELLEWQLGVLTAGAAIGITGFVIKENF